YHCITTCNFKESPYCIAFALINAKKGNLKHGFAFAGKNAYKVEKIVSVKELICSLLNEYDLACTPCALAQ
ncbi:MAG: nitronate monooxygenase, partial [Deltaproteobacteria bacterium]